MKLSFLFICHELTEQPTPPLFWFVTTENYTGGFRIECTERLLTSDISMRPGWFDHKWAALCTGVNASIVFSMGLEMWSLRPLLEAVRDAYNPLLFPLCKPMCHKDTNVCILSFIMPYMRLFILVKTVYPCTLTCNWVSSVSVSITLHPNCQLLNMVT